MNKDITISLSVAAGFGVLIWVMSPVITGEIEPWDAESPYYFVSLLVAGLIVGALIPRHVWAVLLGIVVGQLIYMLIFLPLGPLTPLGIIFMAVYGLLSLIGAAFAARLRRGPETVSSKDGHGA